MIRVRGKGPVFWGVEWDSYSPDKRPIASSFLVETTKPWRRSTKAVRFRLGKRELHVGMCKKSTDPERTMATQHTNAELLTDWSSVIGRIQEVEVWDS